MRYLTVLTAFLLCFATVAPAETNITGIFGSKDLGGDWAPVDDHLIIGVELDFGADDHPLSYVVRYQGGYASDDLGAATLDVYTDEVLLGARYTTLLSRTANLHGYVGGGYALMYGTLDVSTGGSVSENDSGYWIGGGLTFGGNKSGTWHFGVDWTYSDVGEVDLGGASSLDTSGLTTAFTIGWTY